MTQIKHQLKKNKSKTIKASTHINKDAWSACLSYQAWCTWDMPNKWCVDLIESLTRNKVFRWMQDNQLAAQNWGADLDFSVRKNEALKSLKPLNRMFSVSPLCVNNLIILLDRMMRLLGQSRYKQSSQNFEYSAQDENYKSSSP